MLYIIKSYHPSQIHLINTLINVPDNALVFINEGVLYFRCSIFASKSLLFALRESVLLFGNDFSLPDAVKLIDHPQWVMLTTQHSKIITL